MNTDNEFKHNKAYLMQYRRMHTKIERLKDKLERLNERYNLKGVSYSSQPSSTVTQTLDDILAQKEYIEGKISKLTGDAIKISNEIQDRLLDLDNQLEAEILDLYFLENHSLSEIANILCYSERQIERLYVKGIKHLF
ncbi:sigma-70 family RNA polymerase sigma factor [Ligilactobacillus salivarius]|uniref:sigma-70 family RNA polymerase sigma factor n=1 Tax=Ligilactobacillus salivarius TaxID=1624 RepID=UPI00189A8FE3|nr:sigma-70 family RNA polymerase sigma factor [Ligilactobacillus salivarius]MDE1507327.1 sigma-70 family RNA polymerase sigma factor [Ligilactobacillus salivarius]MDE1522292.1 sigma-70 family RNA polymerase sigma factor [Ligilactobacillus salivarius]